MFEGHVLVLSSLCSSRWGWPCPWSWSCWCPPCHHQSASYGCTPHTAPGSASLGELLQRRQRKTHSDTGYYCTCICVKSLLSPPVPLQKSREILPGEPPKYRGSLVLVSDTPASPIPGRAWTPSTSILTTFLFLVAANETKILWVRFLHFDNLFPPLHHQNSVSFVCFMETSCLISEILVSCKDQERRYFFYLWWCAIYHHTEHFWWLACMWPSSVLLRSRHWRWAETEKNTRTVQFKICELTKSTSLKKKAVQCTKKDRVKKACLHFHRPSVWSSSPCLWIRTRWHQRLYVVWSPCWSLCPGQHWTGPL